LLREFFQAICELKAASLSPTKIMQRQDKHLYLQPDGISVEVDIPPPPMANKVRTIADMLTAVERFGTSRSIVFHGQKSVILQLDEYCPWGTVTLPLRLSEFWRLVDSLGESNGMDQRSFLRMLRHGLRPCVPAALISAISKMEIITSGNQRSEVNPGRERGTREFAADLADSGEIPDEVTLNVPVYSDQGLNTPVPIRCSLEYSLPPQPVLFHLRPLPDELERGMMLVQGILHSLLVDGIGDLEVEWTDGPPTVLFGAMGCSE
jgi:hypothetical protein